jgi:large subunit ribosomal protein L17
MASHRIDGRKLGRKMGPRLALYRNLTVSVLRYERVRTTEAKAKEVQGRIEKAITLAKRGDLSARRDQAVRRDRSEVRRPHVRLHPHRQDRAAGGRQRRDRPARAGLKTGVKSRKQVDDPSMAAQGGEEQASKRTSRCVSEPADEPTQGWRDGKET